MEKWHGKSVVLYPVFTRIAYMLYFVMIYTKFVLMRFEIIENLLFDSIGILGRFKDYGSENFRPIKNVKFSNSHPFHLVDPSPWPLVVSFALGCLLFRVALYFHNLCCLFSVVSPFVLLISGSVCWLRDITREGTFFGCHTLTVKRGLLFAFSLFIISEIMLFFAFFWAFWYIKVNPSIVFGGFWPPLGIVKPAHWQLPFLNTGLLVVSGFWVYTVHKRIIKQKNYSSKKLFGYYRDIESQQYRFFKFAKLQHRHFYLRFLLAVAILFGVIFVAVQVFEFYFSSFTIYDSVYGSVFFMITGLHGLHVVVGLILLGVCWFRMHPGRSHFSATSHIGFETAAWYWHFVDVVWLFVFVLIYSLK